MPTPKKSPLHKDNENTIPKKSLTKYPKLKEHKISVYLHPIQEAALAKRYGMWERDKEAILSGFCLATLNRIVDGSEISEPALNMLHLYQFFIWDHPALKTPPPSLDKK